MALNAMMLTSRDMARARVMLRDQSKGEDPYDLLDDEGEEENRDKRRVLIIWCLRSRTDPEFTWDMAWDVPFSEVYGDEEAEGPPTPGSVNAGSEPGSKSATAASKRKRTAVTSEPDSATSTG